MIGNYFTEAVKPQYSSKTRLSNWHEDYLRTLSPPATPKADFTTTQKAAHTVPLSTETQSRVIKNNCSTFERAVHLIGDLSDLKQSLNTTKPPSTPTTSINGPVSVVFAEEKVNSEYNSSFRKLESSEVKRRCDCRGTHVKHFDNDHHKLKLRS
ncbi:hypothetical protein RCL1_001251 [Eukaryota sp. TZLM3-RCL]